MRRQKKKFPVMFIAIAFLTCIVGAYFYITYSPNSFPVLESGYYVGEVSGIDTDKNKNFTFYVELSDLSKDPLFVVFAKDWKPQTEKIEPVYNKKQEVIGIAPVVLEYNEAAYKFIGKGGDGSFEGTVEFPEGTGQWFLRKISHEDLIKKQQSVSSFNIPITTWLETRTRQWEVEAELEELLEKKAGNEQKIKRYLYLLDQKDALEANAVGLDKDLESKLKQVLSEEGKSEMELSERASEASLLNRITQHGKAVRLARKVARREHKWYLANWKTDEVSKVPTHLKSTYTSKTDFEKAIQDAEEKQELLRQIAYERERITQLNEANGGVSTTNNNAQREWKRVELQ